MSAAPVVIDVVYKDDDTILEQRIDSTNRDIGGRKLLPADYRHLKQYPTVYIIRSRQLIHSHGSGHTDNRLLVYIGETNSITRRTEEHYTDEKSYLTKENRAIWSYLNSDQDAKMFVIGHDHFNKSLTLDIENTLMSYVLASQVKNLRLINSRGNPQLNYYTRDELPVLVSQLWRKLNHYQPEVFPAETVIRDSAIFKASPFHNLGPEQYKAESVILDRVRAALDKDKDSDTRSLIVVEGVAGTGKTVLLSHLFPRLMSEFENRESSNENDSGFIANLLVNHKEQLTVYNSIMKRLGLQSKNNTIVLNPTKFINIHSESGHGKGLDKQDYPSNPIDVALVDEAHLLLTQGNQGYRGSRNMLLDIIKRARVVVAVYDPNQVLRHSQEISPKEQAALFPPSRFVQGDVADPTRTITLGKTKCEVTNIQLKQQFRIDASDEIIAWIDDFASGRKIGPIPHDKQRPNHIPYEIRVFDSPFKLRDAINERALTINDKGEVDDNTEHGLSRVLATYDWGYAQKGHPRDSGTWDVRIYHEKLSWVALDNNPNPGTEREPEAADKLFSMPWNYQLPPEEGESDADKAWAEQPHTLGECGSIYTIQGFDLNVAGVIIGPSVKYRDGKIVFDPSASKNSQAINGSDTPEQNLKNELNVLIKRGVHGLYLFAVDSELQDHLKRMAAIGQRGTQR